MNFEFSGDITEESAGFPVKDFILLTSYYSNIIYEGNGKFICDGKENLLPCGTNCPDFVFESFMGENSKIFISSIKDVQADINSIRSFISPDEFRHLNSIFVNDGNLVSTDGKVLVLKKTNIDKDLNFSILDKNISLFDALPTNDSFSLLANESCYLLKGDEITIQFTRTESVCPPYQKLFDYGSSQDSVSVVLDLELGRNRKDITFIYDYAKGNMAKKVQLSTLKETNSLSLKFSEENKEIREELVNDINNTNDISIVVNFEYFYTLSKLFSKLNLEIRSDKIFLKDENYQAIVMGIKVV
jgi:hypothetical protein